MTDAKKLAEMVSTPAECEINYPGCEGIATDRDTHPTGVALGEANSWEDVWFCGSCAWEAARNS
ncbi:hypothetical protein [Streptomyces sp. NBC_01601]|uniref:hypothetical protein n=1 Tax=Streptomyces sp. NBC_01601 TaxID=2975892 RepID=UPI002E2A3E2E|nr:hypothetical protein [Streptomyces sp. NBC_01601]